MLRRYFCPRPNKVFGLKSRILVQTQPSNVVQRSRRLFFPSVRNVEINPKNLFLVQLTIHLETKPRLTRVYQQRKKRKRDCYPLFFANY
jgi:hypothetical protein